MIDGYLEKVEKEIGYRKEELKCLEREVESIPGMGNKGRIEEGIK